MGQRAKEKRARQGLYAAYDDAGVYLYRKTMASSDAYKSNRDSADKQWVLITDDPIKMQDVNIVIPKFNEACITEDGPNTCTNCGCKFDHSIDGGAEDECLECIEAYEED